MDAEGPGDFSDGGSFLQEPSSELELFFVHLLRSPEANAALPGVGAAGTGTLANEITLEFRDAGEDGHNHLARVGGGIGPRHQRRQRGKPGSISEPHQAARRRHAASDDLFPRSFLQSLRESPIDSAGSFGSASWGKRRPHVRQGSMLFLPVATNCYSKGCCQGGSR